MKLIPIIAAVMAVAAGSASPAAAGRPEGGYHLRSGKIAVADFERSIAFYTKYLGLKRGPVNGYEQVLEWPDAKQGSMILLHPLNGPHGLKPAAALFHFRVPDLDQTVKQLRADGYPGVGEPTIEESAVVSYKYKILYIKDPDGHEVEMVQPIGAATPPAGARPQGDYHLRSTKIAVADYERSVAFYTKYLGMKRGPVNDYEQMLVWSDAKQGSMILLHPLNGPRGLKPAAALFHFHVPDLDQTVKQLRADGYPGVGDPQVRGSPTVTYKYKILFIKDPDGNIVEMVQPVK